MAPSSLTGLFSTSLEQVVVDAAEQGDGLVVPAPPQVVGQLLQRLQAFRQMRQDGERADGADRHRDLDESVRESVRPAEGTDNRVRAGARRASQAWQFMPLDA